jgi:hypothetical protein
MGSSFLSALALRPNNNALQLNHSQHGPSVETGKPGTATYYCAV